MAAEDPAYRRHSAATSACEDLRQYTKGSVYSITMPLASLPSPEVVKESFSKQDNRLEQRLWREAEPVSQADVAEKWSQGRPPAGRNSGHSGWVMKACVGPRGLDQDHQRSLEVLALKFDLTLKITAGDI